MKKIMLPLVWTLLSLINVQAQESGDIPIDEAHFQCANFRSFLRHTVDLNQDGLLSAEERNAVTAIRLGSGYQAFSGLNYFPNLTELEIKDIDSIDLTGCHALKTLAIINDYPKDPCKILALDECVQLDTLTIQGNVKSIDWNHLPKQLRHIHILDYSQTKSFNPSLPNLEYLFFWTGSLSIGIQNCPNLKFLSINGPVTDLDLSASPSLETFQFAYFEYPNGWEFYSSQTLKHLDLHDCPQLSSVVISTCDSLETLNLSGCTQLTELQGPKLYPLEIAQLTFQSLNTPNLKTLDLSGTQVTQLGVDAPLETLNLSGCDKLVSLHLTASLNSLDLNGLQSLAVAKINAPLSRLDLTNTPNLDGLSLWNTTLPDLTINHHQRLTLLQIVGDSVMKSLDLSGCTNLMRVFFGQNNPDDIPATYALENLTIAGCTNLWYLTCRNTHISTLDLNGLTALEFLECPYNRFRSLDLRPASGLKALNCAHNQIEKLILTDLYDLEELNCAYNRIESLDLSNYWKLRTVAASHNRLAFLNINTSIQQGPWGHYTFADSNFHSVRLNARHEFNLNLLPDFDPSRMRRIEGGILNGKLLTFLRDTVTYEYRCAVNGTSAFFALVRDPASAPGELPISAENFPDEAFRNYLKTHFDLDRNDSLSDEECIAVTEIDVADQQIKSLQGLQHFVYLKSLNADNNRLTSLDLSHIPSLEILSCADNYLDVETDATFSFDLASLPNFDIQRVRFVRGGTLNGSRLTFKQDTVRFEYATFYTGTALVPQSVPFHLVTELPEEPEEPVSGGLPISAENFPDEAFRLYISDKFDLNANDSLSDEERTAVKEINVVGLGIGSLKGIEHFPFLERLDCSHNQLTALDLSGNNALQTLYCYENSLFVELDSLDRFDLRSLPDFDSERAENWKGGVVSGDTLRFIAKEVSYAYRHRQAGESGFPATVSFTLTSDKQPNEPTANEDAEATVALFRVHPMPFRHTLHIETALDLKRVSLYNMQGRLCSRYLSGFDALPADGLEPGLYLLLLETADGSTYQIKAVKE